MVEAELDIRECYIKYGPMVLRRCRRLLGDEESARDAMQEVFVKLLAHQGRLKAAAPSSLLYRIATNECLNRIRNRGRRKEVADDELLSRIVGADLEGHSIARSILGRLFQREAPSTAEIAVMLFLDGLTLDQVAREVGLSVSGVRKRMRTLQARLGALEGIEVT